MAESSFAGVGVLPQGPVVSPGYRERTRNALPLPARLKLEHLEGLAEIAHGRLRVLSDRARAASDERQRLERRLEELQAMHPSARPGAWTPDRQLGPSGRRWQPMADDNVDDLEHQLEQMTTDTERLAAERDAASVRWQSAARVAEQARDFLGVPRV